MLTLVLLYCLDLYLKRICSKCFLTKAAITFKIEFTKMLSVSSYCHIYINLTVVSVCFNSHVCQFSRNRSNFILWLSDHVLCFIMYKYNINTVDISHFVRKYRFKNTKNSKSILLKNLFDFMAFLFIGKYGMY